MQTQITKNIDVYNNATKPFVAEAIERATAMKIVGSPKATFRKFAAENQLIRCAAGFDEKKFLADRCRVIKVQAFGDGGRGNHQILNAIMNIENYLIGVGSPAAMQMLGDLQQAGYNGFNSWCAKYGI